MDPDLPVASLTVLVATTLALVVALRDERADLRWIQIALVTALVAWVGSLGLRAGVGDPELRSALVRIAFLGTMAAPPLWLLLAARLARPEFVTQRPLAYCILAVPSFLTYIALLTNADHQGIVREAVTDGPGVARWAGPLFLVFLGWAYACLIVALGLYFDAGRRLWREHARAPATALAIAGLLPIGASVPSIVGLAESTSTAIPAAFVGALLLISAAVLRHPLLPTAPLADRDVIEHLRDGVLLADSDGTVLDANPAAHRLLGRPPGPVCDADLESLLRSVVPEEDRAALHERLQALTVRGEGFAADVMAPGDRRLRIRASAIRSGQGIAHGLCVLLRDRTEASRYEEIVRRTEKLETVGTLAAGIAHEVNNPLAFVRANLGELCRLAEHVEAARGGPAAKLAEDLQDLGELTGESLEGIERIERIVADMQRLSSAPNDGLVPVDVNDVVREAARLVELRRNPAARLRESLDPGLPSVLGAPQLLVQAVLNLLVNAFQALDQTTDPAVEVETRFEGEAVVVRVSDNGPGVPDDVRGRVFQPFYSTKRAGEGTGLGLSIVRDILRDHGGEIALETPPGGNGSGARFVARLPVPKG